MLSFVLQHGVSCSELLIFMPRHCILDGNMAPFAEPHAVGLSFSSCNCSSIAARIDLFCGHEEQHFEDSVFHSALALHLRLNLQHCASRELLCRTSKSSFLAESWLGLYSYTFSA